MPNSEFDMNKENFEQLCEHFEWGSQAHCALDMIEHPPTTGEKVHRHHGHHRNVERMPAL